MNGGSNNYQQYGYRPSKLKSLNNRNLNPVGQPSGLSGDKIRLGNYNSQEKLGGNFTTNNSPIDPAYLIQGSGNQYMDPIEHVGGSHGSELRGRGKGNSKMTMPHGSQVNLKRQMPGNSSLVNDRGRQPSNQQQRGRDRVSGNVNSVLETGN